MVRTAYLVLGSSNGATLATPNTWESSELDYTLQDVARLVAFLRDEGRGLTLVERACGALACTGAVRGVLVQTMVISMGVQKTKRESR